MSEDRYYPSEICLDCGRKHGRIRGEQSRAIGMWNGTCGWCGQAGSVTSPRDFRFPDWSQSQHHDLPHTPPTPTE